MIQPQMTSLAKPMIGFGEVRHTRLRPKRHAFAYRTYFLMLPMRQLRVNADLGALAVNRASALSFHDADHGDGRGPERGGALAWLESSLHQHGITDATGEIWLHCFPRVWGYAFKPVSFWYCHNAQGALRAIVAEVNNTFGERHCYLLAPARYGHTLEAEKVFHVSPFCDVTGDYRFRFMRTGGHSTAEPERSVVRIEHGNLQGPLLITSVSGHLEPLTTKSLRRAQWCYPALTLMVTVRIHWQALQLWWARTGFRTKPAPPDLLFTRSTAAMTAPAPSDIHRT
jgi:uncharacterized protein